MLVGSVALFLAVSILLYCLFAGADFGAGMLEAFPGSRRKEEQRQIIAQAMGPVWEANHVWLVLAVVILFMGFPKAYSALSVSFHIPLTLMLLGIILRGCAFTFRHYDAVHDHWQRHYSAIFVISSFLTPMMLGVVAGATLRGDLRPVDAGFHAAFIGPWASPFCFSVGFFTCVLFAFLAAVYLIGETKDAELRAIFVRRALLSNALAVLTGALVFVAAEFEGLELMHLFGARALSLASMGGATLILAPLWIAIGRNAVHSARILVAAQVGLVLIGWFRLQYPAIINSRIDPLTIYSAAAPEPALRYLLYALMAGSMIIFPALIYLLVIFKLGETDRKARGSAPG
jgi:cytochrome d ubiquinol oxidase subunit II